MEARAFNHRIPSEQHWFAFTSAGDVAFALRTTLAGIAVLLIAMWLQIDVPRWAMWTVFIVSPPVRGNALRKTGARLVGTVIGCAVGLVCVVIFPQEPAAFYLLFSLWLGGCAYWATLRRGYISYAASLAAFTSAIVAADVSSAPLNVWQAAVDRGAATVLGTLFAFIASEAAARSDDVPGELAGRISALVSELLDWGLGQLEGGEFHEPKDAPFTAKILGLDETFTNASAERPALHWVKPWVRGLPTALLCLQSAVLSIRATTSRQGAGRASGHAAKDVLERVAAFFRSSAGDLPSVRRQAARLAAQRDALSAQTPAVKEIVNALLYVLGSLAAILSLKPPDTLPPLYPPPRFVASPRYATTNLIRTLVGMLLGFLIWDASAWPYGDTFLVNVAVALVIFVTLDDPVSGNWINLIGNAMGGLCALAAKYLVLENTNDLPLTLAAVLLPLLFVGAWAQTKPKLASLGIFFMNGLLVVADPSNPQVYDFVHDVNVLIATVLAYTFVAMVFLAIGAPRKGTERVAQLLRRMRQRRWDIRSCPSRHQRLFWETQMYDHLQRLQAVTNDPRDREHGVNLIVCGLRSPQPIERAPGGLAIQ